MKASREEFSQGGVVLFACFVGIGVGFASLNYYTAGMFLTAYEREFGWSRSLISAQGLVGVTALILLSPIVGNLVDKVGTRIVASVSLFLYGLCFLAISRYLNSVMSFLVLSLLTALVAAGSTPVTFTRTVTGWFDTSRGIALGMALVGTGIAAFIAPLYLAKLIEQEGWRQAAQTLSGVVFFGAAIVAIFLRDNPNAFVDKTHSIRGESENVVAARHRGHAMFSKVFWLLAFIFFFVALAVSGLIIHFIPMLVDGGLSLEEAGRFAAVIGISVIIGRLTIGLLIDQFFAPRVAFVVFVIAAVALTIFSIHERNVAVLAAFAIGLTMGAEVDLISFLTSRYFCLKNYGKIYGALYAIFIIGSAVSPVLMGALFDLYGSYSDALILSITALAISAAAVLCLPKYPELTHE